MAPKPKKKVELAYHEEALNEVVTVGLAKVKNQYACVVVTTKAGQVVSVDYGELQPFNFAKEDLKIKILELYEHL